MQRDAGSSSEVCTGLFLKEMVSLSDKVRLDSLWCSAATDNATSF